ncbi:MAG: hypothetical protein ACLGGV_03195 [Bacteroidia bacterium]
MKHYLIIVLSLLVLTTNAQKSGDVKKPPLDGFSVSGSYRFYVQHRLFVDPYAYDFANGEPIYLEGRSILIGDDTQLPELTLNISGKPTSKTTFGTDLVVWNQNTGNFDYYRNLQLGINLYGNFATEFANVNVRAGGIHWHSMTAFTMKSFIGYNRFSVFERNPWDPQYKKIDQRYDDYYSKGAVSQDARWANQAVQGFIVDLTELPLGFSANVIYGKTQNAGSAFLDLANDRNDSTNNSFVKFFDNTIPNNVYGGRLIKNIANKHTISLNTFNRRSYSDVLAKDPIDNNIYTTDFNLNFKNIRFSGEVGTAKYSDVYNQDTLGYGEMASIKINLDKKLSFIPIEIHAYRISPNAVNNNAEFVNTSVNEATSAAAGSHTVIGSNGVLQQNGSAILGIGQMANNRQGVNINTDIKIKDLTLTLGNGISKEIENKNNQISFSHNINGLTMARFWRWSFPSNVGPYNRKSVLYRGVFEAINLTDLNQNGEVVNDKYFNNIEAQVKYKFNLFKKPWYFFYLGAYNSVQTEFSPITVFTEDAYVRVYTHQLENYYAIHPKFVLAQYIGIERIIGNYNTQVDVESERPLNQEGIGFGLGFDYMIAKNTGLYFRHRYFQFKDMSFEYDTFSGHETTIELKIYF